MFRAQQCSKHVEEYSKLIIKREFVHLVGQLLRLPTYYLYFVKCQLMTTNDEVRLLFNGYILSIQGVPGGMCQTSGQCSLC